MIKKIFLASPRGFCAGVKRAVKILDLALKKHGPPLYVRHQIVHNRHVVKDFEKKGVVFVERLDEIPKNSVVVFSAHGSPPDAYRQARKRNLTLYDATCPLVTKVHIEAKQYEKKGYFIFYIGKKNHQESIGVMKEVLPRSFALISDSFDLNRVNPPQTKKIVILTQTTLSFDDTAKLVNVIRKKYPKAILPTAFDICFSTQNRQNAVKQLVTKTKIILIIGSKESSNANRLVEVAKKRGAEAYLINDVSRVQGKWFAKHDSIGLTAGASTPESVIQNVINRLKKKDTILEEMMAVKEKVVFPLPVNLSIYEKQTQNS